MKVLRSHIHVIAAVLVGSLVWPSPNAQAALVDRGGGLIYDTVLNVTWLQDALWAKTKDNIEPLGQMNWSDAMTWVDQLTYYDSVRNVTWSNWRLPKISPLDGVAFQFGTSTGGNTDDGYNISAPGTPYAGSTASELAYMYYVNLGNIGRCSIEGWHTCLDSNPDFKTGPFLNLLQAGIWFGSQEGLPFEGDAWAFDTGALFGAQGGFFGETRRTAWAVMDGDVGSVIDPEPPLVVPEPSAASLVGVGLLAGSAGVFWRRRRQQTPQRP